MGMTAKKGTANWEAFSQAIEHRVDQALEDYRKRSSTSTERLYLWYREAEKDELCGMLGVAAGKVGNGAEFAVPEPVPNNLAPDGVRAWMRESIQRSPVLNTSL